MRIIDLSLDIAPGHLRWPVERTAKGDFSAGDLFQATTLRLPCHGFTHVDARRHFFADGATIEATPLDAVVGPAKVIDLKDTLPNQAITHELLAERGGHIAQGDRVLLITAWHRHRSYLDEMFWREAPYLTREAADWLKARGIMTVGYDFPQDYVIRCLLDGDIRPQPEHVTHDVLLRGGVHMIEYLTNTQAIAQPDVFLSAAPLKVPHADGAPTRAYVVEGM